jgi:MFS family permease
LEIIAAIENKSTTDSYVLTQVREVEYSVDYEREHTVSWRNLFLGRHTGDTKTMRRLLLGAGTQFMQQFEGINIVSYYFPTVLIEYVGVSNSMARLISACNSISYLVCSGLAVLYIERWGRRGLMLVSTLGQGLSFLIITVLLSFAEDREDGNPIAKATIVFFFLFFMSFGVGMLGVPWLYPTEINSLPMRTKGAAVATATNW